MKMMWWGILVSCALLVAPTGSAAAAGSTKPADGQVVVVQAAPGMTVDLSIDGKVLDRAAHVGDVLGPYALSPGIHRVRFTQAPGQAPVTASLKVQAGSSSDVVLHLPADVGGAPVVTSYAAPLAPIGPGKARLLLAHTATVAPADVQFDKVTVFRDIANGEFAVADVPDGGHEVALLPSGIKGAEPLLGPLHVTLRPRTVTMVYAVGRPANGSMNVITHTLQLTPNGAIAPRSVRTGSVGLAAHVHSVAFPAALTHRTPASSSWLTPVVQGLLLLGAGTAPH